METLSFPQTASSLRDSTDRHSRHCGRLYLGSHRLETVDHPVHDPHCVSHDDRIALVYGTALRSLSIALVLAITVFRDQGAEMGLLVALAYIVQIQSATWYARLSEKIFRRTNENVS